MNNTQRSTVVLALVLGLCGCSYMPSWMGGEKKEIIRLPGERITVLPEGSVVQPDASLKDLSVILPSPSENSDWPQHTGTIDAANGNLAIKGDLSIRQESDTGGGESFETTLVVRPVVGGGAVFAMDALGNISSHDVADIDKVRWRSRGVAEDSGVEIAGGGLAYDDGKLYAVSGQGRVATFDAASGRELWHTSVHIPFRSAPRVDDGKIFAITIDNQTFTFDAATGNILWNHRGINEMAGLMNSVSPAAAGGVVVVPYSSGELYALAAADGKVLWDNSLSPTDRTQASSVFSGIGGDPLIDGQVVFAVSSSGMLSVFGMAQGQPLWDRPISALNTPWIAGDYLYLLTTDNTLVCLVKYNGGIKWSTQFDSFEDKARRLRPITWKGPVMVGGQLALVSSNGTLALVSATDGSITTTKSIPDDIFIAPVVAGGRMYLVGKDATLYSLQ